MNEKFKQLAEQAEILIGEDSYGKFAVIPGHEKDPLSRQGKAESYNALEKFAELIVRECADICMEMAAKCAGLEGDGALAKDCAYWIKKDFGAEE
jgi:hypothetical protein